MRCMRIEKEVEALRIAERMSIRGSAMMTTRLFGKMNGEAGDWLITEANGLQYFVTDVQFRENFNVVDSDLPGTPAVTVTTPTTNPTPTWSWEASYNSSGKYLIQLDAQEDDGWVEIEAMEWTPEDTLALGTHTLYVRAVDSWGVPGSPGSAAVEIVSEPPAPLPTAPVVSLVGTATEGEAVTPAWTGDGTNGSGNFRYSWDDGSTWSETTDTSVTTSILTVGTHTIQVQEAATDGAWGPSGTASVEIVAA